MTQFKVVSKRQKLKIYEQILNLPQADISSIKKLISSLNSTNMSLDKNGFQVILNILFPEIENETLKGLIENKYQDKYNGRKYSILFISLKKYIAEGFHSIYEYYLKKELKAKNITLQSKEIDLVSKCVDNAMRNSFELLYNTFKYQLVKYLGVFNLMFKICISIKENKTVDDVSGIDILLTKLEYNAFSEEAKIASDYGVPSKIVAYYDSKTPEQAKSIINSFDNYEKTIYEKVRLIIEA
ncbi:MAG: hypothetical protein ACK5LP_00145 [Campylobacteraceae bacterium]